MGTKNKTGGTTAEPPGLEHKVLPGRESPSKVLMKAVKKNRSGGDKAPLGGRPDISEGPPMFWSHSGTVLGGDTPSNNG